MLKRSQANDYCLEVEGEMYNTSKSIVLEDTEDGFHSHGIKVRVIHYTDSSKRIVKRYVCSNCNTPFESIEPRQELCWSCLHKCMATL